MTEKLTRKQFIELASKEPVEIDEGINYVVVKVNSENISMSDKLKEQLIDENKYDNTYIGFTTFQTSKPYGMENLPIYGKSDKYETKYFKRSLTETITDNLKDRNLRLLNRHHEFKLNQL